MSVDTQVAAGTSTDSGSDPVGSECYVPDRGLGIVRAVSPVDGRWQVAWDGGGVSQVAPGDAVLLPLVGDFVTVPRDGGVLRGVWIGLVSPVDGVEAGRVTARVMCGGQFVEHVTWAVSVRAALVVSGRAEPDVADAARAAALVCGQMDSQRRDHTPPRADEQSWCSDFDEFMQDWGLQGRVRDFDVEVQVTGQVSVRVQAPTGSIAEGRVSREDVQELVSGLDGLDFEVQDAEPA